MKNRQIIFLTGSRGSGKTSLGEALKDYQVIQSDYIDSIVAKKACPYIKTNNHWHFEFWHFLSRYTDLVCPIRQTIQSIWNIKDSNKPILCEGTLIVVKPFREVLTEAIQQIILPTQLVGKEVFWIKTPIDLVAKRINQRVKSGIRPNERVITIKEIEPENILVEQELLGQNYYTLPGDKTIKELSEIMYVKTSK